MSVAAAGNQVAAAQSAASGRSAWASWLSAPNVAAGVVTLLAFAALFVDWLLRQHRFSLKYTEDWGHAYLVPFITGYFIYSRREALKALAPEVFWPGLLPLLLGIAMYFNFTLADAPGVHMFQGFAIVLCVAGIALLAMGPRVFAVLAAPIGYLAFAVTLSDKLMGYVTFQLQLLATYGSWVVLNVFGVTTDLGGNTLVVTTDAGREIPLNVAEACSGMRMVVAFVALAVAVALLSCRHWWQRIALVLLAAPVALFTNVLRVVTLAVASIFDANLAAGDAHMLIGVLWLVPAFGLFLGITWVLKNLLHDEPTPAPAGGAS